MVNYTKNSRNMLIFFLLLSFLNCIQASKDSISHYLLSSFNVRDSRGLIPISYFFLIRQNYKNNPIETLDALNGISCKKFIHLFVQVIKSTNFTYYQQRMGARDKRDQITSTFELFDSLIFEAILRRHSIEWAKQFFTLIHSILRKIDYSDKKINSFAFGLSRFSITTKEYAWLFYQKPRKRQLGRIRKGILSP
jgi:hypothetical protein